MEVKRCFICMYKGLIIVGTNDDVIFKGSQEKHVRLCYSHSVELYKFGQFRFVEKYAEQFSSLEIDTAVFSPAGSRNGSSGSWY